MLYNTKITRYTVCLEAQTITIINLELHGTEIIQPQFIGG